MDVRNGRFMRAGQTLRSWWLNSRPFFWRNRLLLDDPRCYLPYAIASSAWSMSVKTRGSHSSGRGEDMLGRGKHSPANQESTAFRGAA